MVTRLPTLAPSVRSALMVDPALSRLGEMDFDYHVGTRVLKTDGQSAKLQAVTGGKSWSVNADLVVFISLVTNLDLKTGLISSMVFITSPTSSVNLDTLPNLDIVSVSVIPSHQTVH